MLFGRLISCLSIDDAANIVKNATIVLVSKYVDNEVKIARKNFEESIRK